MTTDQELHDLLVRAGDGAQPLDTERLNQRLNQRQRHRTAGRAVGVIGSVALVVIGALGVLPFLQQDRVELRSPLAVTAVDPDRVAASDESPTLLPSGARTCDPVDHRLAVRTRRLRHCSPTRSCSSCGSAPQRQTSWWRPGPHASIPEEGDILGVSRRDGFVDRTDGLVTLTVSDANSLDDTHFRVMAEESVAPQTLVEIMSSIPAIERAPFTTSD